MKAQCLLQSSLGERLPAQPPPNKSRPEPSSSEAPAVGARVRCGQGAGADEQDRRELRGVLQPGPGVDAA
eukprot:7638585-Alexandrium_andersonii.AAC.1